MTVPPRWQPDACYPYSGSRSSFIVATFNIHSGKGMDQRLDLGRIAAALRTGLASQADLIGLYEVRAGFFRNQAVTLAQELQRTSWFVPTEHWWWHDHFGNAVLVRVPPHQVAVWPLVNTRGKAYRHALLLFCPLQHSIVKVIVTHLDSAQDRTEQLKLVYALFRELSPPVILMGDLNSTEADPTIQQLMNTPGVHSALHDVYSDIPFKPIDWIIHRGMRTLRAEYLVTEASDHPLLAAELILDDDSVSKVDTTVNSSHTPRDADAR